MLLLHQLTQFKFIKGLPIIVTQLDLINWLETICPLVSLFCLFHRLLPMLSFFRCSSVKEKRRQWIVYLLRFQADRSKHSTTDTHGQFCLKGFNPLDCNFAYKKKEICFSGAFPRQHNLNLPANRECDYT
jgi:hypothetical protein